MSHDAASSLRGHGPLNRFGPPCNSMVTVPTAIACTLLNPALSDETLDKRDLSLYSFGKPCDKELQASRAEATLPPRRRQRYRSRHRLDCSQHPVVAGRGIFSKGAESAAIPPASSERAAARLLGRLGDAELADHIHLSGRRCVRCGADRLPLTTGAGMPMKDPVHPGRIVREDCLHPLSLTVTAAAQALGVSRQALNNIVNERAGITAEMAVRLAKAFGGVPEAWLALQAAYDLAQVRKREKTINVRRVRAA